jgi:hypothetical protein
MDGLDREVLVFLTLSILLQPVPIDRLAGLRCDDIQIGVVQDLLHIRPDLETADPGVLLEIVFENDGWPHVAALSGNLDRVGNREDEVRLAIQPAFAEMPRRRHVGGIALRLVGVYPLLDDGDLVRPQAPVIGKMPKRCLRIPGRHFAQEHRLADGCRPRPDFLEVVRGMGAISPARWH